MGKGHSLTVALERCGCALYSYHRPFSRKTRENNRSRDDKLSKKGYSIPISGTSSHSHRPFCLWRQGTLTIRMPYIFTRNRSAIVSSSMSLFTLSQGRLYSFPACSLPLLHFHDSGVISSYHAGVSPSLLRTGSLLERPFFFIYRFIDPHIFHTRLIPPCHDALPPEHIHHSVRQAFQFVESHAG
jgi:hypothetical protein